MERIVYIDILNYNELNDLVKTTLIIELMGKHSNIILAHSNNIIIDSLRHLTKISNSNRDILPGYNYNFIDNSKQDFLECSFEDFYKILNLKNFNSISSCFTGISKFSIEYALTVLSINDNNFSKENLKNIYNYFKKLLSTSTDNLSCININSNYYLSFMKNTNIAHINFFIDDFYYKKEENEKFTNLRNSSLKLVLDKLKKFKNKLDSLNSTLQECKKMETYRLYGELITSNLYKIENYNQSEITLENYYDNNKPITIYLDKTKNPSCNAKLFFKKYRKLQNASTIALHQKEILENEIEYLESIVYDINNCSNFDELKTIESEFLNNFDIPKNNNSKTENTKSALMPSEYKIDRFYCFGW